MGSTMPEPFWTARSGTAPGIGNAAVLVTVSATSSQWPMQAPGGSARLPISHCEASTVISAEDSGPVESSLRLFSSSPVTVAVNEIPPPAVAR